MAALSTVDRGCNSGQFTLEKILSTVDTVRSGVYCRQPARAEAAYLWIGPVTCRQIVCIRQDGRLGLAGMVSDEAHYHQKAEAEGACAVGRRLGR